MHVIVRTYAILPFWHTHQGEDKRQVRQAMNVYSDKFMRTTANTCLEISADTMHQYVASPTALKTMMCMLSKVLDRGAISVYTDATVKSSLLAGCHH